MPLVSLVIRRVDATYGLPQNHWKTVSQFIPVLTCRYSAIEMETDYKVATFSYLSNGGDGLTILKEKATSRLQGPLDTDVFVNYIKRITPITLGVENRYTVLRSGQHLQMTSGAAQVASISSRITLLLTLLLCGLANQMHK